MRKKRGNNYTFYLPDDLATMAKLEADQRDRSTSYIVQQALIAYFNRQKQGRE